MANAILTGIKDVNGRTVVTGQTVRMHYFYVDMSSGGAIECETEVIGVVRVRGYRYKTRLFCVQTEQGIKYPFSLMQDPSSEIEVLEDYNYAKNIVKHSNSANIGKN